MSGIEWNDELSVGIVQSDEEHQQLVRIYNRLDQALTAGKGTRVMHEILSDLTRYTRTHFANEEKLMAEAEYPDIGLHRAQHRQLIEKLDRLRRKFTDSRRRISKDMMSFLKYWLMNHILLDDMAFGTFLQQTAARPEATQPQDTPA